MDEHYSALCDDRWHQRLDIGQLLDLGYAGKVTDVRCGKAVYKVDAEWVTRAVAKGL